MLKYFIKSISIEGFRGINNQGNPLVIDFQSDGVTSLFGENGKGKSSIFEAIIFSILGRIIRFDNYHGDIKDKKAIKNLFHSGDGNIKIDFLCSDNSIVKIDLEVDANGTRTFNACSITNPEEFLELLASDLNFLDYNSFEKIMLQSSEDTGKLFSNLVGFGNFIHIKENFDKISRTQNINNDFGKTAKEHSRQENNKKILDIKSEIIKKITEIGIVITSYDKDALLKEVKIFLKKQYSLRPKKIDDIKVDFDKLVQTKIGNKYEENVEKLNREQESLAQLSKLQSGINKLNGKIILALKNKFEKIYLHVATENDLVLGKLYDDAILSYNIIEIDENTCVLCYTKELGDLKNTFYNQIILKVENYKRFKEKYMNFSKEFSQLLNAFKIDDFENKFLLENERFFLMVMKGDYLDRNFFEINDIQNIISKYKIILSNEINRAKNSIKELKSLIPPRVSELVETNNVYKFVTHSVFEIDKLLSENDFNTKYLAELENWIAFIGNVKEDYENSYNILMDDIASMIDADTKLFFKEIMGNVEITPKVKKENKGQKVNILLEKFYSNTNDNKAASLLSESYRNALSLSIYFAAALKSKNPGNFIIVDDITSSFDSGHQLYLLDLIKTKIGLNPSNKKGKQIILLTHDGILKKVLNENGILKNWTSYNLNSNQDTVSLKPFKSDDLKLIIQKKINNGSYVGSDFRMYYEFVLLEIIEKLNLEIPFSLINSNDNKMVRNLCNAIFEIVELKRTSRKIYRVNRLPSKTDFKLSIQLLPNHLSHWATGREISLATTVLTKIVDDIDNFKKFFQYNCTCPAKNAGWVYYKSLSTFKLNGCTCTL